MTYLFFHTGLCLKAFKKGAKRKFFINICHTDEIPAPKDISESELHKLIEEQNASDFKVPLSVTKPRDGKDKSGNVVEISDIAVNTEFFNKKIKRGDGLFYHFLITIVFESIEQKYKIEIDTSNFVLMQNRLCIGEIVEHQIYNRDVQTVEKYHEAANQNEILGADDSDKIMMGMNDDHKSKSSKVLIQEISSKESYKSIKKSASKDNMNEPDYKIFKDYDEFKRKKLVAEFYLPKLRDVGELSIMANDDRLVIESQKNGYMFEGFLPHKIDENKTDAEFDNDRMVCI